MIDKRPEADRILIAEIWGEARHRARWRELSSDEETVAVAALRELAGGRADLLRAIRDWLSPLDRAAALVAGMVHGAPAAAAAGPDQLGRGRLQPAPLHP